MFKATVLQRPLKQGYVQCTACEHWCAVAPGEGGKCGVRRHLDGTLRLVVYGRAVAVHIDPIEKKPLHHVLPGERVLSLGTLGCNLTCGWCQNWEISQTREFDPELSYIGEDWPPEAIVEHCLKRGIPLVAFTYNEPAVFFEYAYDTARLAAEAGVRAVFVSSGFETLQAIDLIAPYLTAVNVDLKASRDETYRRHCGGRLEPVKRNIRHFVEAGVWTEVTTLLVPDINDTADELKEIAEFLVDISPDLPWHVSAFHPMYRMRGRPRTPVATVRGAWEIGRQAGLRYVYTGNVLGAPETERCEDTLCPGCDLALVARNGYQTQALWREPGRCPGCGTGIAGLWW